MLTELEKSNAMHLIKGSFQSSVSAPEFDMKYLMKAEWHNSRNAVTITKKITVI